MELIDKKNFIVAYTLRRFPQNVSSLQRSCHKNNNHFAAILPKFLQALCSGIIYSCSEINKEIDVYL